MKISPKFQTIAIALIALVLISSSCKKDKNTITIKGVVSDAKGNTIPDVHITLQGTVVQGGIYTSEFSDIISTSSAADGSYIIETERKMADKYRIRLFKQDYFSYNIDMLADDVPGGKVVEKNLRLDPYAWIKLKVWNENPITGEDKIVYKYDDDNAYNCSDCCSNENIIGEGFNYSKTLICKLKGNDYAKISWTVYKEGVTTGSESIFCAAFDTTEYVLNY